MDLSYGSEYEEFRKEVRAFLGENWPPKDDEAELPRDEAKARFRDRATAVGYLNRAIPKRYGGSEQPPDEIRASIIREEFSAVRAPGDVRGIELARAHPRHPARVVLDSREVEVLDLRRRGLLR